MTTTGRVLEPLLLKQGVAGLIPATSTKTLVFSFPQLTLQFQPQFRVGYFWSIWSNYGLRQLEAMSYSLGLFEAHFEFLVEMRV
jgi:hypothetical protein